MKEPHESPPTDRKLRVLVAEDDDDMRMLLESTLVRDGYEVVVASDGIGLLDHIQAGSWCRPERAFDGIVADVNMPGLTALEVLAAVHCSGFTTPIVLVTADRTVEVPIPDPGVLPAEILRKPFAPEDLTVMLRRLISRS